MGQVRQTDVASQVFVGGTFGVNQKGRSEQTSLTVNCRTNGSTA